MSQDIWEVGLLDSLQWWNSQRSSSITGSSRNSVNSHYLKSVSLSLSMKWMKWSNHGTYLIIKKIKYILDRINCSNSSPLLMYRPFVCDFAVPYIGRVYIPTPLIWALPCDSIWPVEFGRSNGILFLALSPKKPYKFPLLFLYCCLFMKMTYPGKSAGFNRRIRDT